MLRKISLILSCGLLVFSASSFATTTHMLRPGITLEYDLPPNDPQVFVNYMFWTVVSSCKLSMEADSASLFAEALAKKGTINNMPLASGESLEMNLHSGDVLNLSAEAGAKIRITNRSNYNVHATCKGAF